MHRAAEPTPPMSPIRRLIADRLVRDDSHRAYERRLVDQLWREGLSFGRPMLAAGVLLSVAAFGTLILTRLPSLWSSILTWAPWPIAIWSVTVGAAAGRSWGGSHTGAGTEAQSFVTPATAEMRYSAWAIQGLTWAVMLWIVPILPFALIWYLERLVDVPLNSLVAPPVAVALLHVAALVLAFVLAFRRSINATSARSHRLAVWPAILWPGLVMLLFEVIPRASTILPLDHPAWGWGLPFVTPPPAWLDALLSLAILLLAGRELRLGREDHLGKDAVARPLAHVAASPAPALQAPRLAQAAVFLVVIFGCPLALAALSRQMVQLARYVAPNGSDGGLAVAEQHGGVLTGSSLVDGKVAFLSEATGVRAYDIADPAHPRPIGWAGLQPAQLHGLDFFTDEVRQLEPMSVGLVGASGNAIDVRRARRLREVPLAADVVGWESLVTLRGDRYALFRNHVDSLELHAVDPAFPMAVRSLGQVDIGTEMMGMQVERMFTDSGARETDDTYHRMVLVVRSGLSDTSTRQILIVAPSTDDRMRATVIGSMPYPHHMTPLAVHKGDLYQLEADKTLVVSRLTAVGPGPISTIRIATLDLPPTPVRASPLAVRARTRDGLPPGEQVMPVGEIAEDRLLFIRPLTRALTVVAIGEPESPRLVAHDAEHCWTGDARWGDDGLVSGFSSQGAKPDVGSLVWRLLQVGPSGFEPVASVTRLNVLRMIETRSGAWVKTKSAMPRPLEDLLQRGTLEEEVGRDNRQDPWDGGESNDGLPFWIHGERVTHLDADRHHVTVSDLDGGHAWQVSEPVGGDLEDPAIVDASSGHVVVVDRHRLLVLDMQDPDHERVVVWRSSLAPSDTIRSDIVWARFHGPWLVALLRDATLRIWARDQWDDPPRTLALVPPSTLRLTVRSNASGSLMTVPLSSIEPEIGTPIRLGRWLALQIDYRPDPGLSSSWSGLGSYYRFVDLASLPDIREKIWAESGPVLGQRLPDSTGLDHPAVLKRLLTPGPEYLQRLPRAVAGQGATTVTLQTYTFHTSGYSWGTSTWVDYDMANYLEWRPKGTRHGPLTLSFGPWKMLDRADDNSGYDALGMATAPDGRLALTDGSGRLLVAEPLSFARRAWQALWGRRIIVR